MLQVSEVEKKAGEPVVRTTSSALSHLPLSYCTFMRHEGESAEVINHPTEAQTSPILSLRPVKTLELLLCFLKAFHIFTDHTEMSVI